MPEENMRRQRPKPAPPASHPRWAVHRRLLEGPKGRAAIGDPPLVLQGPPRNKRAQVLTSNAMSQRFALVPNLLLTKKIGECNAVL